MRALTARAVPVRRRAGWALAALLPLALGLSACSDEDAGAPATPTAPVTTTASPTPTPTPTPAPTPESTPLQGGPVLAVKIDHVDAAYPRVGIGSADVVYVDPVEFGLTRLMAIFSSTLPESVGPIRSARPNDPVLLANYGVVPLVFSGASRHTYDYLARGSQIDVETGAGFRRDTSRRAPHNLMGSPEELLETGGGSQPPEDVGFRFGAPAPGGTAATQVATRYPALRMSAVYDDDQGAFEVSTNGRVEIDALTGDPVAPTTIVVQKVAMHDSTNVTTGGVATPLAELVGSGDALVLRDGRVWEGTWSRADLEAPTLFETAGEELTFAPGPLWIWIVPVDQAVTVE